MCFRFEQNISFSQLRFYSPVHLKFPGEITFQNTFLPEQLPVTAFDKII